MNKDKKRTFGGKIENFINKEERNFENKHLKAYLKGHEKFRFGFDLKSKEPLWYRVKEIFI